jgi:hypothetical protein
MDAKRGDLRVGEELDSHAGLLRALAGKQERDSRVLLLDLEDFAAGPGAIVAAVAAKRVWSLRTFAVGAGLDLDQRKRKVGAAASLLGLG